MTDALKEKIARLIANQMRGLDKLGGTVAFRMRRQDEIAAELATAILAIPDMQAVARERSFGLGDLVSKKSGSHWGGRIVGFYSTTLTPVGYAVESDSHPGSVQIYPEAALELIAPAPPASEAGK